MLFNKHKVKLSTMLLVGALGLFGCSEEEQEDYIANTDFSAHSVQELLKQCSKNEKVCFELIERPTFIAKATDEQKIALCAKYNDAAAHLCPIASIMLDDSKPREPVIKKPTFNELFSKAMRIEDPFERFEQLTRLSGNNLDEKTTLAAAQTVNAILINEPVNPYLLPLWSLKDLTHLPKEVQAVAFWMASLTSNSESITVRNWIRDSVESACDPNIDYRTAHWEENDPYTARASSTCFLYFKNYVKNKGRVSEKIRNVWAKNGLENVNEASMQGFTNVPSFMYEFEFSSNETDAANVFQLFKIMMASGARSNNKLNPIELDKIIQHSPRLASN